MNALQSDLNIDFLELLAEKYPSIQSVCTEIINLKAILNLPKGTEHFMSDLHGEYEAFFHIFNNCSGVLREKVHMLFDGKLSPAEQSELCTLIYYPEKKLEMLKNEGKNTHEWYSFCIHNLTDLTKLLSSKYTRSKVRKAMPKEYGYVIDELLHALPDEDGNRYIYHKKIIDTLITLGNGDDIIIAFTMLIKRLAVDHLHILGDIYDRGERPDTIIDFLRRHHSMDIEWGNHDILWMGAAAGSYACIATVVKNSLTYRNTAVLENGYGISLRPLVLFAEKAYPEFENPLDAARYAITIILLKEEGKIIKRNTDYRLNDRALLEKIDFKKGTVEIGGKSYELKYKHFPTIDPKNPYALTKGEEEILEELEDSFRESRRLNKHIRFLYDKGSVYRIFNGNLLFHGCIPMEESGAFLNVEFEGKGYRGKSLLDYADKMARKAYYEHENLSAKDFMWYLWCAGNSPLSGKTVKTFERTFIENESVWEEPKNAYYALYDNEHVCQMILREFGLFQETSHIVNGHTPVIVKKGESPVKANRKLLVIDGGFCKPYQKKTGIAGYTLIFNSHGLRIMAHQPFESMEKSLSQNADIQSTSYYIETQTARKMVKDTDIGEKIKKNIFELEKLLEAYQGGLLAPKATDFT